MLREDGHVLDDGTTTRLDDRRYYMTTTTGEHREVLRHMEFHAQTVWPNLDVNIVDVTDQWAGMALAGPRSREALVAAVDEGGREAVRAMPFMGALETTIAGAAVRVFRITFSGELGYEIHAPADWGTPAWEHLLERGAPHRIAPYGTEAMGILRIEKGHVAGPEIDGRTTPIDLGFERMLRPDGRVHRALGALAADIPGGGTQAVRRPSGARRRSRPGRSSSTRSGAAKLGRQTTALTSLGHVTSAVHSPNLNAEIALALLRDGRARIGERLVAASPVTGESRSGGGVQPALFRPRERPRPRLSTGCARDRVVPSRGPGATARAGRHRGDDAVPVRGSGVHHRPDHSGGRRDVVAPPPFAVHPGGRIARTVAAATNQGDQVDRGGRSD